MTYGPIPGRHPTVFFTYPAFLKIERPFEEGKLERQHLNLTYTANLNAIVIRSSFKAAGFSTDKKAKAPNKIKLPKIGQQKRLCANPRSGF